MPILIAHRGNLHGPGQFANRPSRLKAALAAGFHIEVDLWVEHDGLWLGHDEPDYPIDSLGVFPSDRTWWHCKNAEALRFCLDSGFRAFWHENDRYALVSDGTLWCYPGAASPGGKYVQVLPESTDSGVDPGAYAVCSDYVADLRGS